MKNLIKMAAVLISLVILSSAFTVTAFAESGVLVHGKFNFDFAYEVIDYINDYREQNGLEKLESDFSLMESAMIRAAECSVNFSHIRPNGKSWTTALKWRESAAENIAMGFATPKESTDGYYSSESHRINMLGDYTRIGVGVFTADNGLNYWIHDFTCGEVEQTYKETGVRTVNVNIATDEDKESVVFYSDGLPTPADNAAEFEKTKSPDIASVTLSDNVFEYNGRNQRPELTVKDKNGNEVSEKYYDIEFPSKSIDCGTYKIKLTHKFRDKTFNLEYKIILKATSITAVVKKSKKNVLVKWQRADSHSTGVKLYYALNKKFTKNVKSVSVKRTKTSKLIKGLKAKKTYYFRLLVYKKAGSKTFLSSWSNIKKIKIKFHNKQ